MYSLPTTVTDFHSVIFSVLFYMTLAGKHTYKNCHRIYHTIPEITKEIFLYSQQERKQRFRLKKDNQNLMPSFTYSVFYSLKKQEY